MALPRKSMRQRVAPVDAAADDLCDYLRPAARRRDGRGPRTRAPGPRLTEDVRVTATEIEVFEAWFGYPFDELFATRY